MKIICAGVLCCVIPAVFAADSSFDSVVRERIAASATPACIAVALVGETTNEALACTESISPVPFDRHSAFEIGSITKGFTGLLLAGIGQYRALESFRNQSRERLDIGDSVIELIMALVVLADTDAYATRYRQSSDPPLPHQQSHHRDGQHPSANDWCFCFQAPG